MLLGIIDDRIDCLSDSTKQLLRAASVLGRKFGYPVLVQMLRERGSTDIDTGIEELVRQELITRHAESPDRDYTFRHDLIREVAYNGMLADARALWHRRAGHALEQYYGERADQGAAILAHHFTLAEEWVPARDYLIKAAQRAASTYSNGEAIGLLTQALDLVPKTDDPGRDRAQCEILRGRAAVLGLIGRTDEEASDLARLHELCQSRGERSGLAEASLLLSGYAYRTGRFDEALERGRQSLGIYADLGDDVGRGHALAAVGTALGRLGSQEEARERLLEALDLFRSTGHKPGEAAVRKGLGTSYARAGAFEEAVQHYSRAADLFHELRDRRGEGEILGNLGSLHYLQAEYADAVASFSEARDLFRSLGDLRNEAKCLNNLGMSYLAIGDYRKACPLHERALSLYSAIGDEASRANALSNLGIALQALAVGGDPAYEVLPIGESRMLEEAFEDLRQALEIYDRTGDQAGSGRSHFNLGSVFLSRGCPRDALAHLAKARALASELGIRGLAARTLAAISRAHLQRGESAEALASSSDAVSMLEQGTASEAEEIRFSHSRALSACGQLEEATTQLQLAVAGIRKKAERIRDDGGRQTYQAAYHRILEP